MMPRRLLQLFIGLVLYGASMALMLRAALGLDPWDGGATWMMQRAVGPQVARAALLFGMRFDAEAAVRHGLALQVAALLFSVVANGIAGALYIGAGLGPGPRDGRMTGLARRTGWSLRLVRTGIELTVLGFGWLLGGTVGVGTLLYAFTIGPLVQIFLPMVTIPDPKSNTQETTPVKA